MQSEQIDKIAEALSQAQGEIQDPHKGKTAKVKGKTKSGSAYEYEYNYADIADVLKVTRQALSKHHISISQPTIFDGDTLIVRTRLMHKSGQFIESDYPVCRVDGDHQRMGAAMTYARRYALCSIVGVAADEDMDGQGAAEAAPRSAKSNTAPPKMPRTDDIEHGQKMKTKKEVHEYFNEELKQCNTLVNLESLKREYNQEWRERVGDNFNAGMDELFMQSEEQIMRDMEAAEANG